MKSILREQRRSSIAAAAVTVLVGILLVVWPNHSVDLICKILGVAVCVTGVIYILGWLSRRKEGAPIYFILPGVILIALGLWLVTMPESVVLLIQYLFGAILIFHGVIDLQGAMVLMRCRAPQRGIDLVLSILTVVLGILVIINPFGTFAALIMLIGIALIYDGVSDLYLVWKLSRVAKEIDSGDVQE